MIIHLFGSTTTVGRMFTNILKDNGNFELYKYSRKTNNDDYIYCNMDKPCQFNYIKSEKESIIISFAPIWITANFLSELAKSKPFFFKFVQKIIVCSSSSVLTKRFSFNSFDKNLFLKLRNSENKINDFCSLLKIKSLIVQPSLVYGSVGKYKDKNFSKIIKIMRYAPFLILPSNSGLRQPISCYQLANVFFHLISQNKNFGQTFTSRLLVGGDDILNYNEMLFLLKKATKESDPARKCLFIKIPDLLFIIFAFPLAIISTKFYESVLRIFANLCDFTPQSTITNQKSTHFPDRLVI